MPRYIVQTSHTAEECLQALDEYAAQGDEALKNWSFACATGDHSNHVAYGWIDAPDEGSARQTAGSMARGTQVTEVGQLTADQIRSFHQS